MRLEVVPVPVADIDRARAFYVERVGFVADHDVRFGDSGRILQLTPPGSSCSILLGAGLGEISEMRPGSVKGLHLVVPDIDRAREELVSRGVEVGGIADHPGGVRSASFHDPDGNSWVLQEISAR